MSCFGNKSNKKKNNQIILVAFLFIIVLMVASTTSLMQSVGDRRTVETCDAIGAYPDNYFQATNGMRSVSTDKTEGTGSMNLTRTGTGSNHAYLLLTFGNAFMPLTNEHTFSFWYKAIDFTGLIALHPYFATYEDETAINGDEFAWTSYLFDVDAAGMLHDTWAQVELDCYAFEGGGNSENGVYHAVPDLERVTAFGWETRSDDMQTLLVDFVEVVWTGSDIPPPALDVTLDPSSASITTAQSQTFTATASGGSAPYTYEWELNTEVQTETSNSLTVSGLTEGTYSVEVTVKDSVNDKDKDSSSLYVTTPGTPPSITYTITVTTVGGGTITDTSGNTLDGSYSVASGQTVTLSPVADTGYQFLNWAVDGTNMTDSPLEVMMNSDHDVIGYFTGGNGTNGAPVGSQPPTIGGIPGLQIPSNIPLEYIVIGGVAGFSVIILIMRRKRWV